ncbi:siroheme synthase CysG [Microvirga massiliensis]|uniref:siroheme synthase CysG n=1 Tax=Microvirga massiliensis TaxID=1033741 RepID=UPI00062BBCBC|nr:siroheme synthase CysG [Microvirga massiliensis]
MTRHVAPIETRPARLQSLAKLPLFLDVADRRVVIAGGGAAAAWKAELLAAAGAKVDVYAVDATAELQALAAATLAITLIARPWRSADLVGVTVAVAETDGEEAARFAEEARRRGALVNVIDQPDFCDFQFGAIVNRSPVIVAISTDGAAPVLAQAVRRRVEAILPRSLSGWSETAKAFRERLATMLPSKQARRRFWENFVDVAFISQAEEDERLAELERMAKALLDGKPQRGKGEVVVVGAGPGDPELLTLKAVRELQAADVILYDRLVSAEVLELGRREAQRIAVGKQGHGASCRQEDINRLLVDLAGAGQRVVRLKGGDPAIFGRAGEEIEVCRAHGIPVRMVPGITAALAAASALSLSLTHRRHAQRVQFVTGHDRHGELPSELDLDALADPRATTCIYMGRETSRALAGHLIARGMPAATPATIISNVSRKDESAVVTSIGELAAGAAEFPDAGPTLVLIGDALDADQRARPEPEAVSVPQVPFVDSQIYPR